MLPELLLTTMFGDFYIANRLAQKVGKCLQGIVVAEESPQQIIARLGQIANDLPGNGFLRLDQGGFRIHRNQAVQLVVFYFVEHVEFRICAHIQAMRFCALQFERLLRQIDKKYVDREQVKLSNIPFLLFWKSTIKDSWNMSSHSISEKDVKCFVR